MVQKKLGQQAQVLAVDLEVEKQRLRVGQWFLYLSDKGLKFKDHTIIVNEAEIVYFGQ